MARLEVRVGATEVDMKGVAQQIASALAPLEAFAKDLEARLDVISSLVSQKADVTYVEQALHEAKTAIYQQHKAISARVEALQADAEVSCQEAVEAALQAVHARRQEFLEEDGVLEDKKEAIYQSGVPGVGWHISSRCWQVQLQVNAKRHYKVFKPKDQAPAEVERARLLSEAARRDLQHEVSKYKLEKQSTQYSECHKMCCLNHLKPGSAQAKRKPKAKAKARR
mmetsp:Transcript_154201/g.494398  ORF Transcript_154201/g.494398 Transcript_154201/m.494398 type:complete len:225 (+) Transcript_154201:102-776(+)